MTERPTTMLVSTKMRPPRQRAGTVARERLFAVLDRGTTEHGGVTLVCAPAGWGKTTLLTSWTGARDRSHGWFQLDEEDNDPERFLSHLIAVVGAMVSTDLAVEPHDPPRVIDLLVAALDDHQPRSLVLDDYHLIGNPVIHAAVDRLMRWIPTEAHLILSSRTEPPLMRLPRRRASGTLGEIRAADLAFTPEETPELISSVVAMDVPPELMSRLVTRTEGWGAGLYLSALSMERTGDAVTFVDRFTGDDRLVADYLRTELIDGLPPSTRRFLVATSILDELHGSLCDAVLDRSDSDRRLRDLERDNVLLARVDSGGDWYRAHHLLRDWLRSELDAEGVDAAELHERAATWHRHHGSPEAAVHHADASGRPELLAEIIEAEWRPALAEGRVLTVLRWFDLVGDDVIATNGALCLARAHVGMNAGDPPEAVGRWMSRAEESADADDPTIAGRIHRNRSIQLRLHGDLAGAEERCRSALALPADPSELAETRALLGGVLYLRGELDGASDSIDDVIANASPVSDQLFVQFAASYRALISYDQGRLTEARAAAHRVLELAAGTTLESHPTLAPSWLVLGLLALDDGDLDRAREHIDRSLDRTTIARNRPGMALALMASARLAAAERHSVEARRLLGQARALIDEMPTAGALPAKLAVTEQQIAVGSHRRSTSATDDGQLVEDLTDRELAVLRLLPSDLSVREIGGELHVSHNTVKGHLKAIYRKLLVTSRTECIDRARSLGLL